MAAGRRRRSKILSAVVAFSPQKQDSRLIIARVVLLLLLSSCAVSSSSSSSSSSGISLDSRGTTTTRTTMTRKQFLWLSDIHLDPFYGTAQAYGHNCVLGGSSSSFSKSTTTSNDNSTMGRVGCDAPYRLVEETIRQVAADVHQHPGRTDYFVILTGDLCRHGNDRFDDPMGGTRAILSNISQLLRQTLGDDVSIIPSLGNNDVTPDYYLDVNDPTELLDMASQGFDVLFDGSNNTPNNGDENVVVERQTFQRGGYLARNVSDSLTILSINTIPYSTNHVPDNDDEEDPFGQFEWLEHQMNLACREDRSVYIIGHIPPAMGSYRHSQLWKTQYLIRYYSILQRTSPCMTAQLFGHLHADEFRSLTVPRTLLLDLDVNDGVHLSFPLLLASSVTPVYGSNPSYRWVTYEPEIGTILDYDTYYLNLLEDGATTSTDSWEWKHGPSFIESYGIDELSFGGMQELMQRLNQSIEDVDSPLWTELLERQHIYATDGVQDGGACRDVPCRREWICTLTTITSETFASCLEAAGANPVEVAWVRLSLRQRILVGAVLTLATVVLVGFYLCRVVPRYLQRRQYQQHGLHDQGTDEEHVLEKEVSLPMDSLSTNESSTDTWYCDDDDREVSDLPSIT